jgi:hypothetical protein
VDILLVKREGRFSGEAFVVLGSPLQIQMAVDKNKSYMGRRYVEVFRAKKLVSSWARASPHPGCTRCEAARPPGWAAGTSPGRHSRSMRVQQRQTATGCSRVQQRRQRGSCRLEFS